MSVFPKEKNDECRGWSISYLFLDSINDELTCYENCPELEQIELVLSSDVVAKHIEKEIQKLKANREVLLSTVNFYADKQNYQTNSGSRELQNAISDDDLESVGWAPHSTVKEVGGKRARQALKSIGELE